MRKTSLILASSFSLLLTSSTLASTNYSEVLPYLKLDSGIAKLEKVKTSSSTNSSKQKSNTHALASLGLGLGVDFGDKIRSDITFVHHLEPVLTSFRENARSSVNIKRKPTINSLFLNVYYELGNIVSIFNPYLGAGIGVARVKDSIFTTNLGPNNSRSHSDLVSAKNNLAYRLTLGSAFALNENIKLDVAYSYNDYGKTKSKITARNIQLGKNHYKGHLLNVGFRFGL